MSKAARAKTCQSWLQTCQETLSEGLPREQRCSGYDIATEELLGLISTFVVGISTCSSIEQKSLNGMHGVLLSSNLVFAHPLVFLTTWAVTSSVLIKATQLQYSDAMI